MPHLCKCSSGSSLACSKCGRCCLRCQNAVASSKCLRCCLGRSQDIASGECGREGLSCPQTALACRNCKCSGICCGQALPGGESGSLRLGCCCAGAPVVAWAVTAAVAVPSSLRTAAGDREAQKVY